ncbi:toxin-antitoxin system protein HicB [Acetobacter indonesiensis]|uniref:toxin-antitoxin system protein HicB n=1 Tax=Acetobacter indonesiensis TaxID=104101 RepID=UPI001F1AC0E0|nr:toxin-antitoxin system protein HicB [Acetobacter indonesiensis]MCG0995919.1 toxin-antitoxin system protein HicB [Acetobacter indonesiensis]
MRDILIVGGLPAVVMLDPLTFVFRGVFVGLDGNVDFYATRPSELPEKGAEALRVFLAACKARNKHPLQRRKGTPPGFVLEDIYAQFEAIAEERGQTLESFVQEQRRPFVPKREPSDFEKLMARQEALDRQYFC